MKRFAFALIIALFVLVSGSAFGSWWDSSWASKRAVQLPSQDMNKGTTIQIENINFSLLTVKANLDDVRIVDENNNLELNRVCDRTSASVDGNCFFFLPNPITAGQAGLNTTYYMYYSNAGAGAPSTGNAARNQVCDFEGGRTCGFPTASNQMDFNSEVYKYGSYSLAGGNNAPPWAESIRLGTIGLGAKSDFNYSFWVRGNFDLSGEPVGTTSLYIANGAESICIMGLTEGVSGTRQQRVYGSGSGEINGKCASQTGTALTNNTWYRAELRYKDSDSNCYYTWFDESSNVMDTFTCVSAHPNPVTKMILFGNYSESYALYGYFDNVTFAPPTLASGLGAEEELSPGVGSIDLNFVAIEGYNVDGEFPEFAYSIDGNLVIDFNVFNADNNIMHIDVNYGANAAQGSGTVIMHDINLSSTFCTNAQNWDDAIGQCSIDWNISAVPDGNYYIKIDLNGGSKVFTSLAKTFKIKSSYLKLQVRDENKGYPLVSPSVSFNGSTYSLNSEGKITLLSPSVAGHYIVAIWEDSNYPVRNFEFDLNSFSKIDLNVFLIQDDNGQNVGFKFYDTDKTTVLSEKLVRLRHDTNICSIQYLDSSGQASFFLDPDDNYVFDIVKSGSEVLHYYPTALTINVPKNESTLANVALFDAKGSGLAQKNWVTQSAALTYYILANTTGYYSFDFNSSGYNARNYLVSTKGNTATYTLQAYLVSILTGTETTSGNYTFIVTNSISLNPISNVVIKVKKPIVGVGEAEIASLITDSSGQATTSLQYYIEYNLYFYYNNQLVYATKNTPTPTPAYFQVQLAISAITPRVPVIGILSASFRPFNHNIFLSSIGLCDININVSLLNKTFSTMKITLKDSNNLVISERYFSGAWTDGNLVHFDLNLLDFNRNRLLIAIVDVNSTDGNSYHADFGWSVFSEDQWAISNLLSAFAGSNNKMVLGFIALFITLLAVGAACITSLIPGDPLLLSMMTVFILFFWVSIGFLELVPVVFIALFVVFLALLTKAVM